MRLQLLALQSCAMVLAASAAWGQGLPAGLEAGPHPVGFRIVTIEDDSRPTGGRVDTGARSTTRARTLRVHVWHPTAAAGPRLTVGDYVADGGAAAQARQEVTRLVGLPLSDSDWSRLMDYPLTATRDAAPAAGRFPLIIGMLRPVSVAVTGEHLASHGYVVAYVERQPRETLLADGLVREALVLAEYVRDMEVAIGRLRREPWIDPTRLGAQGFGGDGLAQMLLAMRHPDVDAVSLLETAWLSPAQVSSFQRAPAYDPLALRAPLFYAYSENLGRNSLEHIAELKDMRYAPRSLLYLGEPRMTPLDFGTEGLVLAGTAPARASVRDAVTRMAQAAYRYQQTFFDAYVKGDEAARQRLGDLPVPQSGGALVELTHLPAIAPALSRAELQALIDGDISKALARARTDLARDPRSPVFEAAWLNITGYGYLQRGQNDRAIAVMTLLTEAHPRSANAFDSLSEVLEAAGQRGAGLEAAERALALLPGDATVPAAERAALEAGLKARIQKSRGPG